MHSRTAVILLLAIGASQARADAEEDAKERTAFEQVAANWREVFSDTGTGDWRKQWFLDGEVGNPKTRELIEERFREMEWSNGQAKATFSMELDAGRSLKFRSASGDQKGFSAIWTRSGPMLGGATSAIVKKSRPLPTVEDALELLHTYVSNDGDIQSVVEWEE